MVLIAEVSEPSIGYPKENILDKVPVLHEAGYAPGPVWTGTVNRAATGIRRPDLPARSQSGLQYVPLKKTSVYICKTI